MEISKKTFGNENIFVLKEEYRKNRAFWVICGDEKKNLSENLLEVWTEFFEKNFYYDEILLFHKKYEEEMIKDKRPERI